MKESYLSNDCLILRAVEPEDLEIMYLMENNSDLWDVSSITVPYSRYMLKEYLTSSQNDIFADKQLRLMLVRRVDNKVMGAVDLTDFVPLHARAAIGIAVLKEFQGKGYARQAIELLIKYVFDFLHLKQLYAYVPVKNDASKQLFINCGFAQCGLLNDWVRTQEEYEDVLLMQRIQN